MAGMLKKLFGGGARAQGGEGSTSSEADLTFARANNEMQIHTQAAVNIWGLDKASWDVDLSVGTITFKNEERRIVVTAPVQVVGTVNTKDGSWLWGWDHPSVSAPLADHARRVRDFGVRHGLKALTKRKIAASTDDAWTFTALACHLGGGQGGYCCPTGPTQVFLTYGAVTITKMD